MSKSFAEKWNHFWFEKVDTIRWDTFRMVIGILLFIYMLGWHQYAPEWLTTEGYHTSKETAYWFAPLILPPLSMDLLPIFGWILFGSIIGVIFGWHLRWTGMVALACVFYVSRVDHISAFTLNKLFMLIFLVIVCAPQGKYWRIGKSSNKKHSVWPIRVLQITLIIQYFTAGTCKVMHGPWLTDPYVLWTQIQGLYCTDVGAWMIRLFPKWFWAVFQYLALSLELLAPILFIYKPLRKIAFIWGFGFHAVIAATMHLLIYFSLQMLAFYILFFKDETLLKWRKRFLSIS